MKTATAYTHTHSLRYLENCIIVLLTHKNNSVSADNKTRPKRRGHGREGVGGERGGGTEEKGKEGEEGRADSERVGRRGWRKRRGKQGRLEGRESS